MRYQAALRPDITSKIDSKAHGAFVPLGGFCVITLVRASQASVIVSLTTLAAGNRNTGAPSLISIGAVDGEIAAL